MSVDDSTHAGHRSLPPKPDFADLVTIHSGGPARAVEARWQQLIRVWRWKRERHEALTPGRPYPSIVPLLEACRADPRLGQLHPFTSHFTVNLSSCPRYPYVVQAAITPLHDGQFRVHHPGASTTPSYSTTAEEAVALAAAQLADGLRPPAAGGADLGG
ncbi:DUF6193 family natural product biosynthesis protein [Streptomyces sp. N2A]|uniref:DUF6193 family natural product biosynthesis protein n=1 Tax=Streptomyces sp. N2A TaxID=3073936 RepID=UPI002870141D|nr:DUF6193 family natural product biosynthesis protein [Streptomyces sp. N2A]